MSPTPECPFYDLQGVAKYFNVSMRTVQNWILSGQLKGARLGRLWRFSEEDLKRAGRGK